MIKLRMAILNYQILWQQASQTDYLNSRAMPKDGQNLLGLAKGLIFCYYARLS